jgi:hypothetical protein
VGAQLTHRIGRRLSLEFDLSGHVPVIVYQMAKVGSSAVVTALDQAGVPVFHVHRMHAAHLTKLRESRLACGWRIPPVPAHDRLGMMLHRKVIAAGRRAKIITLVREPIGRNFSAYFEHLDDIWHTENAHREISAEVLAKAFIERFTHGEPLTWFDEEMLPVTGIDVYASEFPREGHQVLTAPHLELLVLKSEMDDETKHGAVERFLGRELPRLKRANDTSLKPTGSAYRRFLDTITLPRAHVERMLESRYTRHFYSEPERDELRRRYVVEDGGE